MAFTDNKKNVPKNNNAVIIAEYRLLNALYNNASYRNDSRVNSEIFAHELAKSIYSAIINLEKKRVRFTEAGLLQEASNIDYGVNASVIHEVVSIDDGKVESLDEILDVLFKEKLKSTLKEKVSALQKLVNDPGKLDEQNFLQGLYDIDTTFREKSLTKSTLKSFDEWSDEYIQDLEARKGGRKYSYGDENLDKAIFKGAYPGAITILAASPSMGKSAFVLNLVNNLINLEEPCMYISLEMGSIDTFDRLVSLRCEIDQKDLYDSSPENIEALEEAVQNERKKLINNKKFYFVEDPSISVAKLRSIIREYKQRSHEDYAVIFIDLLTQLDGMLFSSRGKGNSVASNIEVTMNELNALAKEENVHIFGAVQFRRESDSQHITSVEDLDDIRPTLNDIKNSGAIAERSRVVLSIFRKKYYIDRYLRDMEGAEEYPDTLDIQILKNSSGEAGLTFNYMFDGPYFKVTPLEHEPTDREKALANL